MPLPIHARTLQIFFILKGGVKWDYTVLPWDVAVLRNQRQFQPCWR